MQKYILAFTVVFASIVFGSYYLYHKNNIPKTMVVSPSLPPQAQPELKISKEKLYLLINAHRKQNNLPELLPNPQLENSAELKLADMINKKYYRHQDAEGDPGWHFFKQVGYQYLFAGENLAFNLDTEWQILDGWINSPEHNKQLLEPKFEDFGLAVNCTELEKYANSGCITVLHLGLD